MTKIARLPTGKTLRFPDETADDAIDHAVQEHMKDYIAEKKQNKEKEDKDAATSEERHQQLLHGVANIIQSHHILLQHAIAGHNEILEAFKNLEKAIKAPRKRKPIRDKDGKLTGVEEYV